MKCAALAVDSGMYMRFMKLEEGVVCSHLCYRGFLEREFAVLPTRPQTTEAQ